MMDFENERDQSTEEIPSTRKPTPWRLVGKAFAALLSGGLGYIGGLISGAGYGGNYAPQFSFLGSPGYEGSALMAGIVSGGTLCLIAMISLLLLRKLRVSVLAIVGAFIGIAVGAPLFFPSIAPSEGLLAVIYAGSGMVGGVVGLVIGSLTSPRRRKM